MLQALPTPEWFVKNVQMEINAFLWNNKPPRIKFLTAISELKLGGLALTHFENYVLAQKANWTKRLFDDELSSTTVLKMFSPPMSIDDLLQCSFNPDELSCRIPQFYRQTLHAWFTIKEIEKESLSKSKFDILCYNRTILVNGKPVFFKSWYEKGIVQVQHLWHSTKRWLTFKEFIDKYNVNTNFVTYYGLIDALSHHNFRNQDTVCQKEISENNLN